ncbi:hypothetical protein KI387_022134, partial [Taxus chinensis]
MLPFPAVYRISLPISSNTIRSAISVISNLSLPLMASSRRQNSDHNVFSGISPPSKTKRVYDVFRGHDVKELRPMWETDAKIIPLSSELRFSVFAKYDEKGMYLDNLENSKESLHFVSGYECN